MITYIVSTEAAQASMSANSVPVTVKASVSAIDLLQRRMADAMGLPRTHLTVLFSFGTT
jgi:hypothetical protein